MVEGSFRLTPGSGAGEPGGEAGQISFGGIGTPSQRVETGAGIVRTISGGGRGRRAKPTGKSAAQIAAEKAQKAEVARQVAAIKAAREQAARDREAARKERIEGGRISGQVGDVSQRLTPTSRAGEPGGDFGVLTITQRERRGGAPSSRFFVAPSDISPSQAVGLGATLSQIQLTPDLPGSIQGEAAFKRDREAILRSTTNLTDAEIKSQIKRDVQERPVGQQIFSRAQDVSLGGAQLAIGAAEFGLDLFSQLGLQEIEFDDEGKRVKRQRFEFGGILGDIRDQPTGIGGVAGKTLLGLPVLALAGTQFLAARAAVGTRAAAGEFITSFAPFRIPTQTFGVLETGALARDLKFDVASFKQTQGDITSRLIVGRGRDVEGVSLISKQVSGEVGGQQIGFGVTDIVAPKTIFQLGKFTQGLTAVRTESILGGLGGGRVTRGAVGDTFSARQILEGIGGTAGRVSTRTKARLDLQQGADARFFLDLQRGFGAPRTTGTITRPRDEFDIFAGGRGRDILQIGREGGRRTVRVDDFNIRGIEFDIARVGARDQFGLPAGVRGSRPSKRPPSDSGLELSAKQLSASISEIAPKTTSFNGKQATKAITGQLGVFGAPSAFAGTGQFEVTGGGLVPQKQIPSLGISSVLGVGFELGLDVMQEQRPRRRGRGRTISAVEEITKVDVGVDLGLDILTQPATRQRTRLKPKQRERLIQQGGFGGFGFLGAAAPKGFGIDLPTPIFPTFGTGRAPTRRGKRRRGRIGTSLTGEFLFQTQDIVGVGLPKIEELGVLGITPGTTRLRVGRRRVSKRRKKVGKKKK